MRFTPCLNHTCNFSSTKSCTRASIVISQSLASGNTSFIVFNNLSALYGDNVDGVPPPKNTALITLSCTYLYSFAIDNA